MSFNSCRESRSVPGVARNSAALLIPITLRNAVALLQWLVSLAVAGRVADLNCIVESLPA